MKLMNTSLLMITIITIVGCGIERHPLDDVRYFLLDARRPEASTEAKSGSCLHIRPCRIASQFASRSLVYRTGTVMYEQDYYNLFLTNPDGQVTDILRAWFRLSGLSNCISTNDTQPKKYTIEPRIDVLCTDFTDKENPAAVVQLHVLVTTPGENGTSVETVLEKTYIAKTPLPSKPAAAQVVEGLSRSLSQTVQQLEDSLRAIL